jgi:hypothetical protein
MLFQYIVVCESIQCLSLEEIPSKHRISNRLIPTHCYVIISMPVELDSQLLYHLFESGQVT